MIGGYVVSNNTGDLTFLFEYAVGLISPAIEPAQMLIGVASVFMQVFPAMHILVRCGCIAVMG